MGIAPYCAILVTLVAGWAMIKRFKTHLVLIFSGIAIISVAILCGQTKILNVLGAKAPASTGFVWFDMMDLMRFIFMGQVSGIGLTIMVAGGFSGYMIKTGASSSLVRLCLMPLRGIKRPYLVLPLAYWLGELCYLVIPSQGGLTMLLLVAMLPVLVGIGISKPAGAALIVTCSGLSWGPASGISILAAQTAGIDPVVFLVNYQIPIMLPALVLIPVLHVLVQPYFDRKGGDTVESTGQSEDKAVEAPLWYALFPVLPIILLVIFSPLVYSAVKLDTITALLLVWIGVMLVEAVRYKGNFTKVFAEGMEFFHTMGSTFALIVTLIICAEIFAAGLKISGLISMILNSATAWGLGMSPMTMLLSGIIALVSLLTGSGVGAFTSFVSLSGTMAPALGGTIEQMCIPMLYTASLLRCLSPVAGAVIVSAAAIGIHPFSLVRRLSIPVLGGFFAMMATCFIYLF